MIDRPDDFRKRIERQARRMKKAESERGDLVAQTVYLGTLGLLFVGPVVAGAYLGQWLDEQSGHFSARWTVGLLFAGICVGALNVYLFLRD